MHNPYPANRTLAKNYWQELSSKIGALTRPETFALSKDIDPQKFYLEFKNRIVGLIRQETDRLKEELSRSNDCHIILLKRTALVDAVVQASFRTALWFYNRTRRENLREKDIPLAIVARGGYGREEMYFRSDVDIEAISQMDPAGRPPGFLANILEYFEYLFIHQDIFPSASSFRHSEAGAEDCAFDPQNPSVLISLMEHRFVAGNPLVYDKFRDSIKTVSSLHLDKILKYCQTHKTYYDIQDTVFKQEPNVKNEMRRLYWALFLARVRYKLEKNNQFELIRELYEREQLGQTAFKNMQNALNFLSKVRLFLHCVQKGAHRDVLSYEVREQIAQSMGYDLHKFYKQYFYHAAYPLKRYSRNLFWETISFDPKKVKDLTDDFAVNVEKHIIFNPGGENSLKTNPESILQIFTWVAAENYFLSLPIVQAIERNMDHILSAPIDEARKRERQQLFQTLIEGKYFAKSIRFLHEFGILQHCYIPEFKHLCGLLQDTYVHKFPTDIHILHALDVLNQLELNKEVDPFLVELYQSLKNKTALKLAVLLHDIGKGTKKPGQNEEIVGARMTPHILENLGYGSQQNLVEDVAFLVEKHLTMKDLLLLDPEEDDTYEMIWDLVNQDQERLKMLILLTFADRSSTKMKMTASQIDQIKHFYQYTLFHRRRRDVPSSVKIEFLDMIRLPRDLQSQMEIYNEFLNSGEKFAVEIIYKPLLASHLVICTLDKKGLLFQIATVLFFNQLNIVEADIHTRGEHVFDLFKICGFSGKPIEFSNYFFLQKQIKEELRRIYVDHEPISSVYKGRTLPTQPQSVTFKDRKPKIKIFGRSITVETQDIMGAFMMESKVFSDWGITVQRAVLHTHQETAFNIFYLQPADARQIMSNQGQFKNSVKAAIDLLKNPQPILLEESVKTV